MYFATNERHTSRTLSTVPGHQSICHYPGSRSEFPAFVRTHINPTAKRPFDQHGIQGPFCMTFFDWLLPTIPVLLVTMQFGSWIFVTKLCNLYMVRTSITQFRSSIFRHLPSYFVDDGGMVSAQNVMPARFHVHHLLCVSGILKPLLFIMTFYAVHPEAAARCDRYMKWAINECIQT